MVMSNNNQQIKSGDGKVTPMRLGERMLPPQNIETEEAILGGILIDPGAISRIIDILPVEAFYSNAHQKIYQACTELWKKGSSCDLMTVLSWLIDQDWLESVGGQTTLSALLETVVCTVNIDRYAAIVLDKYKRRKLISAGHKIASLGYEVATEFAIIANDCEQELFQITQAFEDKKAYEPPADMLIRIYESAGIPALKGVSSGMRQLDELTGGFKPNNFCVVAGRTGMGKTHFLINVAAQALKRDEPVLFFSAEMSRDQLITRLLAWESGINAKKITDGRVTNRDDYLLLGEAVKSLSKIPLYLDDTSGSAVTPARIQSTIRTATQVLGAPPKLILIDYIQLLGSDNPQVNNRVRELDIIARECKQISGKFEIPVIVAAQISRKPEERHDKRPIISDLREAGGLENESDMIILLYRDDYYNPDSPEAGICEVILAKQRAGVTGTIKTFLDRETSRFTDINLSHDSHATTNEDNNKWEERF
jgi:replicative DNA helicase